MVGFPVGFLTVGEQNEIRVGVGGRRSGVGPEGKITSKESDEDLNLTRFF